MNRTLVAILAGGKGKRMDILCQLRPKPALPFAGKFRVIDFNLSNCIYSQAGNIAIYVDYQRAQLVDYIKRWQVQNAPNAKLDILEPKTNAYVGTADAIYQQIDYLREHPAKRILVMPSDHVYKMDYSKMIAFHEQSRADVTIAAVLVPKRQAFRFGVLSTDENGRVLEYIEKPAMPRSNLASMGIYIFNKDVLIRRLIEDAVESDSIHDLAYSVTPGIVKRDKVYAYKYEGFWRDVGTVEAYYKTNMELIKKRAEFDFYGTWPILTCNDNNEPVERFPHSMVKNSIISPGCVIKGRIENSILSPGVQVDEYAIVRNSILMSGTRVGTNSTVKSCVIDEDVTIGEFCGIGFKDNRGPLSYCTVLGKGVDVPSYTAIPRGHRIMPFSNLPDNSKNMANIENNQETLRYPSIFIP